MKIKAVLTYFVCVVHKEKISITNGKFSCLGSGWKAIQSKIVCSEGNTVQAHLLLMIAQIRWRRTLSGIAVHGGTHNRWRHRW